MIQNADFYVTQYGEDYRQLIVNALTWLNLHEPEWGLKTPIDRDEFIADMIRLESPATGGVVSPKPLRYVGEQ